MKSHRLIALCASVGLTLGLVPAVAHADSDPVLCTIAPAESIPAFSIPEGYPVLEGWQPKHPNGIKPITKHHGELSDPDVPLEFVEGEDGLHLVIPTVYDGNIAPVPTTWKVRTTKGDEEEGEITLTEPEEYPKLFTHGDSNITAHGTILAPNAKQSRKLQIHTGVEAVTFTESAPVHLTTTVGTAPALPNEVLLVCSNGSSKMAPVTWDALKPEAYEAPTPEAEPLVLKGAVNGVGNRATAYITVTEEPEPTPTPTPAPGAGSAILPALGALALLHSAGTGSSGSQGGPAAPNADAAADPAANAEANQNTAPTKGVAPQQEAKRTAVLANTGAESNYVLAVAALLSIVGVSIFAFATRRRA